MTTDVVVVVEGRRVLVEVATAEEASREATSEKIGAISAEASDSRRRAVTLSVEMTSARVRRMTASRLRRRRRFAA